MNYPTLIRKFSIRIVLSAATLICAPHFSFASDVAKPFPCFELIAARTNYEDPSLSKLSEDWRLQIKQRKYKVAQIDALRFMNSKSIIRNDSPINPDIAFGSRTWSDWVNAATWVQKHSKGADISAQTLKEIHKIAMRNHYYIGYNIRRIRLDRALNTISETEYQALRKKILIDGIHLEYTNRPSSKLHGKFRSEPLDEFSHKGEHIDQDGKNYMTEFEFARMQQNEFFKLSSEHPVKREDDRVYAVFEYTRIKDVDRLTNDFIANAREALKSTPSNSEIVRIVSELYRALISIHPFIDGNGRSIRLFCDLILMKHDLPPPLRGFESDFEMTISEISDGYRQAMTEYSQMRSGLQ
jgi:hypothetical protein